MPLNIFGYSTSFSPQRPPFTRFLSKALQYVKPSLCISSSVTSISYWPQLFRESSVFATLKCISMPLTSESMQPQESKLSPSLPLLTPLLTASLVTFANDADVYFLCLKHTIQYVLTIPTLPNRLPLTSLTHLSARLPLSSLHLLLPVIPDFTSALPLQSKVHLLANLTAFTPPRYSKLSPASLDAYLKLVAKLFDGLPPNVFEPLKTEAALQTSWVHESDQSDTEVDPGLPRLPPPTSRMKVDAKTQMRMQTLPSPAHLTALLNASSHHPSTRLHTFAFFLSLCTAWPARRDKIMTAIIASTGGGLVRELYRGYVRGASLGKNDDPRSLMGACCHLLRLTCLIPP